METQHTKGEWKIDGNFDLSDNYCKYIKDEKGTVLCSLSTLLDGKNNTKKIREAEANAKLIAAAPYGHKKHNENIEWCDLLLDKLTKEQTGAAIKVLAKIKSNSISVIQKATQ